MTGLAFTVPGDVRGKGRPKATARGGFVRMYTDEKTVSYENLVKLAAREAGQGVDPLDGPLVVTMIARFVPPASTSRVKREAMLRGEIMPTKKPDLDNIIKVLDGLNGIAFADDAQIVEITARKLYAVTPGLDVTIHRALSPVQAARAA